MISGMKRLLFPLIIVLLFSLIYFVASQFRFKPLEGMVYFDDRLGVIRADSEEFSIAAVSSLVFLDTWTRRVCFYDKSGKLRYVGYTKKRKNRLKKDEKRKERNGGEIECGIEENDACPVLDTAYAGKLFYGLVKQVEMAAEEKNIGGGNTPVLDEARANSFYDMLVRTNRMDEKNREETLRRIQNPSRMNDFYDFLVKKKGFKEENREETMRRLYPGLHGVIPYADRRPGPAPLMEYLRKKE